MQATAETRTGKRTGLVPRTVWWVAGYVLVAALVVFAITRPVPPLAASHRGTWVGRDSVGMRVVYHFEPDGSGYRVAAGRTEPLRYEVDLAEPQPDPADSGRRARRADHARAAAAAIGFPGIRI